MEIYDSIMAITDEVFLQKIADAMNADPYVEEHMTVEKVRQMLTEKAEEKKGE